MNFSRRRLYQIAFLICALFVVARFVQAPDFSSSLLGFGFLFLPWLCFAVAIYMAIKVQKVLKLQKNIEAMLHSLVEAKGITSHPSE
jgi:hypothetical protein